MSQKDGIKIPSDILAKNALELKKITQSEPRVISLQKWISTAAAVAAVIAVALVYIFPSEITPDPIIEQLSSVDPVDAYDAGLVDFELDMVLEYSSPDDFEVDNLEEEIDVTDEELNQLLDELSDDEIYNYLNS
ncbi:MAG: hypothetical protein HWD92_00145 [Flavobacteriia bacterium]|nr:hypothetical protein [Flavobacteriia bacterium]